MNASTTPMQYLDKAMTALDNLGLIPADEESQAAPIMTLLDQISELDSNRVAAIARTLDKASLFNDVVREQVQAMEVGERYKEITEAFNSIRDDAKSMVQQLEDGKIDTQPWVTQRMPLAAVPQEFPSLYDKPDLLRAVIDVEGDPARGLGVAAGEGMVWFGEVQPPGRRRMAAEAWLRGRSIGEDTRFE